MVRKTTSEEGTVICLLFFLTMRIKEFTAAILFYIYSSTEGPEGVKWELHGIFFLIFLYTYRFSFTFSLMFPYISQNVS
jgi:hypothetical protein